MIALSACGTAKSNEGQSSTKPKVGVILPDTTSSVRWERFDKPWLEKYLAGAGVEARIENAQNDPSRFVRLGEEMISQGVKVLLLGAVDAASASQVEKKANEAGVPAVNYDRLTVGGSADYYVSFDGEAVGSLQAEGLLKCLGGKPKARLIEVEGAKTDNNSTLFYNGQQKVLKPRYDAGELKLVANQWIENWDNKLSGQQFERMLTAAGDDVDGVVAANDGFAQEIIAVLKRRNVKVPVTGQDATVEGLRAILAGDQCMTVYKSIREEAAAATGLVSALAKGGTGNADTVATQTIKDPQTGREIKSLLLTPVAITKDNVRVVVEDQAVRMSQLCTEDMAQLCRNAGLS
ncbi:sugar ABC transporter substrate-binding protein [Lentzea sp. NBRC 105346]|nr:sugar ABC transporter substrate-binding protein [Lentzea sp. NBRC 105346]